MVTSGDDLTPLTPAFNTLLSKQSDKNKKNPNFEQMLVSGIRSSILNEKNLNLNFIKENDEESI